MFHRFMIILCVAFAWMATSLAQDNQPILSLDMETTNLQTGQEYFVNLRLSNADNIWLVSVELSYEPEHLFIFGTSSGSPMNQGELFPFDQSIEVFDLVQGASLRYLVSRIAPAEPINEDGLVASFRIYPLQAGTVDISFADAELNRVVFTTDAQGQRIPSAPETIRPAVTVLTLNISGDTVEAPSEATATPTITPSPDAPNRGGTLQVDATLEVVAIPTVSPTETMENSPSEASPTESSNQGIFILAIVLVIGAGIGLIALFVFWRRGRNKAA
jgi:hypothetical protein